MKKANWFVAVLFLILVSCCTMSLAEKRGTCGDDLTWVVSDSGVLTISGFGAIPDYKTYNEYAPWYSSYQRIKTVVVDEGVTYIGNNAFYGCNNLTSLSISSTVANIGWGITTGCWSLQTIAIDENNPYLSFRDGMLLDKEQKILKSCLNIQNNVTIPEGITAIADRVFCNCYNLREIIIPEGLTSIGAEAFLNCSGLTGVTLPASLISIGSGAFSNCSCLSDIIIPDGVMVIPDYAFSNCYNVSSVTFPAGLKSIGEGAFSCCNNLIAVSFPAGMMSIGNYAFQGCSSLSTAVIPDSVESIGDGAFTECFELSSLSLPEDVVLGNGVFTVCPSLQDADGFTIVQHVLYGYSGIDMTVVIPNNVYKIERGAFRGSFMSEVTIPESVTEICADAFSNNPNLISVVIPSGVTQIEYGTFSYCPNLTTVVFQGNVTSIGDIAFSGCPKLANITFPNSLTRIGSSAFGGCTSLSSLVIPDSVTEIGMSAFNGCERLQDEDGFVVVNGILFSYHGTAEVATIPDMIHRIDGMICAQTTNLSGFVFPDYIDTISKYAFTGMDIIKYANPGTLTARALSEAGYGFRTGNEQYSLRYIYTDDVLTDIEIADVDKNAVQIIIPETVTKIADNAFSGCTKLTDLVIPEGVSNIGYGAFYGCTALSTFTLPQTLTVIGTQAFANCSNLTGIVIPIGVSRIESYTFYRCSLLEQVSVPTGIEYIGTYAFMGCTSLPELHLPDTLDEIGSVAFSSNIEITADPESRLAYALGAIDHSFRVSGANYHLRYHRYILNDDIAYIKYLSSVDKDVVTFAIPDFIDEIAARAFDGCLYLTGITIPDGVKCIGTEAFANCSSLEYVTLSESELTEIRNRAFANCISLREIYLPSSIKALSEELFINCTGLTEVQAPEELKTIGARAFSGCSSLQRVGLPYTGFTSIGEQAFANCFSLEEVNIPDSVTTIGQEAFLNCTGLSGLTLWNDAVLIGTNAFSGCSGLRLSGYTGSSAETYASAHQIPFTALASVVQSGTCGSKAKWALDENGLLRISGSGAMYNYAYDRAAPYPRDQVKNLLIENGVTSIGNYAFYGFWHLLDAVRIPDTVIEIGSNAFGNCYNLNGIVLGSSVETIESGAFYNCNSIHEVVFPDSLKTIRRSAFTLCTSLSSLVFGNSPVVIEEYAFQACSALANSSTVVVPIGTIYNKVNSSFPSFPEGVTPVNAVYDGIYYRVVDRVFIGAIYAENEYINETMMAVVGCDNDITSVSIRDTVLDMPVRAISEYSFTGGLDQASAFDAVASITGPLVIPDSVEYIGYNAAYHVQGFTSISLGSNVKMIGAHAFNETNISSTVQNPLVIPASVQYIGNYAFCCPNSESLVIKGGSLLADACAFAGGGFKHIRLEGNMQLNERAFFNCQRLIDVSIGTDADNIQGLSKAFSSYNRSFLTFAVADGNNSYSVIDGVLYNKSQTELICFPGGRYGSYSIPEHVVFIQDYAFANCPSLYAVLIENPDILLGENVFHTNIIVGADPGTAVEAYCGANGITFIACSQTACGPNLTWSMSEDGTLTIIGTGEMSEFSTSIPAPWGKEVRNVVIREGVTTIGENAFIHCADLLSVRIPLSMSMIQTWAFVGCDSLGEVYYAGDEEQWNSISVLQFNDKINDAVKWFNYHENVWAEPTYIWSEDNESVTAKRVCTVYVDDFETEFSETTCEIISPNESQEGLATYVARFTNPAFLEQIKMVSIPSLSDLSVLRLPMNLRVIDEEAFSGAACEAVIIPEGCTSIESRAFADCVNLRYVWIPQSVTYIADDSFDNASPLIILDIVK